MMDLQGMNESFAAKEKMMRAAFDGLTTREKMLRMALESVDGLADIHKDQIEPLLIHNQEIISIFPYTTESEEVFGRPSVHRAPRQCCEDCTINRPDTVIYVAFTDKDGRRYMQRLPDICKGHEDK